MCFRVTGGSRIMPQSLSQHMDSAHGESPGHTADFASIRSIFIVFNCRECGIISSITSPVLNSEFKVTDF